MVEIGAIGSIWYQIGQLFFWAPVLFKDHLKIRLCIIVGNLLFVLNAALGWPFWPDLKRKPAVLAIDTVIWEGIIGLCNIVRFIYDYREYRKNKEITDEEILNNEEIIIT